jgi:hypothetical protein
MFQAWSDLGREREFGMAVGPIPFTAMVWWAERQGIEGSSVDDFCALLSAMDDIWLKKHHDKEKSKSKSAAGTSHRSRPARSPR